MANLYSSSNNLRETQTLAVTSLKKLLELLATLARAELDFLLESWHSASRKLTKARTARLKAQVDTLTLAMLDWELKVSLSYKKHTLICALQILFFTSEVDFIPPPPFDIVEVLEHENTICQKSRMVFRSIPGYRDFIYKIRSSNEDLLTFHNP